VRFQRADRLDAEHDARGVHPGPDQEGHQLAEVVRARAQPGQEQAHAHVEHGLQRQRRDGQQPVPGQRLASAQHDGGEHDHGKDQLLELDQHVTDRQAGARNGSALISGRLSTMTRDEVMNARWVKLKMKMPVMRKAKKFAPRGWCPG